MRREETNFTPLFLYSRSRTKKLLKEGFVLYRYYKYLVIPGTLIIFMCVLSGFCSESPTNTVKTLLDERTGILQQVYFGQADVDMAVEKLTRIETQPLLAQDADALCAYQNKDLEQVLSMDIVELEKKVQLGSYLTYSATLRWHMNDPQGSTAFEDDYQLVLKYSGEGYKLSEIQPLEQSSQNSL